MVSRHEFSRVNRVRKALMREVADIIFKEVRHPQFADEVISVTDVDLTQDLRYARIFISIMGDPDRQKELLTIILEAQPRIRAAIGRRIRLRYTPEIEIRLDDSLERGTRVTQLLDKISRGEEL